MNLGAQAAGEKAETGRPKSEFSVERQGLFSSPLIHKIVVYLFIGLPWGIPLTFIVNYNCV
jgi:hypothetical protein